MGFGIKIGTRNSKLETYRSWIIGLTLTPISVFWMLKMEMLSGGSTQGGGSSLGGASYPTAMSIFFHVVFILFLFVLVQRYLPKRWKRQALNSSELAMIYAMISVGTAVAGVDMLQVLVPMTAYPIWFATPENDWQNIFLKYLPSWWVVSDSRSLEGFYNGKSSLYTVKHLRVWLPVVATWLIFLSLMLIVFGCFTLLLRRQWIEHERLTYPVIQLPMALIDSDSDLKAEGLLLSSNLFWLGFIITIAITLYNGLAYLFPILPLFVFSANLGSLLREPPWNAIGFTPIRIFPFVVSMAFLIPQELSLSGWLFYWLAKGMKVIGAAAGWNKLPGFPYARHQSFGAYMGICALALYTGRRHFKGLLSQTLFSAKGEKGEDDLLFMRTAALGAIVGMILLVVFSVWAGMSLWVATTFFSLYFILSIGISRIRAELGAPVHDLHFMGPEQILVVAMGSRRLGVQNLSLLSVFYWFNRAYRSHPMPFQLEGLKLAHHESAQAKGMFLALIIGGILGGFSLWWLLLHTFYQQGGLIGIASYAVGAFGREPFARLDSWLAYPTTTNLPALIAIVLGSFLTIGMLILRMRYFWWSLHPLGYALADDYAMNWIWSSVFVGWALKSTLLHMGGIKTYRATLPLFLGLIMGEFSGGCLWSLTSLISGKPMYAFKNW